MKKLITTLKHIFYQNENDGIDEIGSEHSAEELCFHCYAEEPYVYFLNELCK